MARCCRIGPRERPRVASSDRTMTCVLGLLGAAALLLLPAGMSWVGEAAGCHQVRSGDTLGMARRHGSPRGHGRGGRAPRSTGRARHILKRPAILDLHRGQLDLSRPALLSPPGRLRRESDAATRDRLSRMRNMAMIERFRRTGLLVRVPVEAKTYYVAGVSAPLRVLRPWTKSFIEQVSQAFYGLFDQRLRITSLTRTRAVQRRLLWTNSGAAPVQGPVQSTHLTGAAFDLSKRSLSHTEVVWLRTVLAWLSRQGLIHVAEEFRAPHFHVMVRKRYGQYQRAPGPPDVAGGC
jgi:hypothetical protein